MRSFESKVDCLRDHVTFKFFSPTPTTKLFDLSQLLQYGMPSFTELHGETLEPFVEKYDKAKNQKERDGVLKNAADALKKTVDGMEDKRIKLPKDLKLVYLFLFLNLYSLISLRSGNRTSFQKKN